MPKVRLELGRRSEQARPSRVAPRPAAARKQQPRQRRCVIPGSGGRREPARSAHVGVSGGYTREHTAQSVQTTIPRPRFQVHPGAGSPGAIHPARPSARAAEAARRAGRPAGRPGGGSRARARRARRCAGRCGRAPSRRAGGWGWAAAGGKSRKGQRQRPGRRRARRGGGRYASERWVAERRRADAGAPAHIGVVQRVEPACQGQAGRIGGDAGRGGRGGLLAAMSPPGRVPQLGKVPRTRGNLGTRAGRERRPGPRRDGRVTEPLWRRPRAVGPVPGPGHKSTPCASRAWRPLESVGHAGGRPDTRRMSAVRGRRLRGSVGDMRLAHPLMIDADPGIDDALAILLALASPEVDLRLVTTVHGNVGLAQTPETRCACCTWRAGPTCRWPPGPAPRWCTPGERAGHVPGTPGSGACSFAVTGPGGPARGHRRPRRAAAKARPRPVTVAAIGPLTNLALLLRRLPGRRGADRAARGHGRLGRPRRERDGGRRVQRLGRSRGRAGGARLDAAHRAGRPGRHAADRARRRR